MRFWHAVMFGGFIVAYATADEDTYAMHLFAGYLTLAALTVRLLAAAVAPQGSPLRLPRPRPGILLAWLRRPRGRSPLYAWMAAILLAVIGAAALSGVAADGIVWLEDPHEAVSELSLWLVLAHAAIVLLLVHGHRLRARVWPTRTSAT